MNYNLIDCIKNAKAGDKNSLHSLILKFDPLITKYSRFLNYEDSKSDLMVCFIQAVYKFPTKSESIEDRTILSYINKCVVNAYINISKNNKKLCNREYLCEIQEWNHKEDFQSNIEFYDLLKYLNEKEMIVITLKYLNCFSDIEISKKLNISRQYVNKLNKRALSKIKKYIA